MTPTTAPAKYRADLDPPPYRIAQLPVARGYPVPWFVGSVNGEPEFRGADPAKLVRAVNERRCWVCGEGLGRHLAFVIGPMCSVNRVSSEPPCHLDCARYSARNCPFLSKPQMTRREHEDLVKRTDQPAGIMIPRNPGVTALWICRTYVVEREPGGVLFRLGPPTTGVEWWRERRPATRAECVESIRTGLPALVKLCRDQADLDQLKAMARAAEQWLPAA